MAILQLDEYFTLTGISLISDLIEAQGRLQQTEDQLTEAKTGYFIKRTIYMQVTGRQYK
ncbi:MAG: hypothetical protein HYV28_08455 [Ignavibacteriales bacterium]|nr:hypothetical protein [Ignavibacteriales bacterium]